MGVRLSLSCLGNSVRVRQLFEPRTEEITVDWRKLHSEEPQDMSSSPTLSDLGGRGM